MIDLSETPGATADDAFGVYVHWPYCARICPYCDFNVYRERSLDEPTWRASLITDLKYWASRTPNRLLSSLYFGGGTPSLMSPSLVGAIIEACDALWGFAPEPEITIEANPNGAEADRFRDLASVGVNRLSLGVQSLHNSDLVFLGRDHSAEDAIKAIECARRAFSKFSFDLIYARPEQSAAAWRQELSQALTLAGDHLSLYQLTIEPGTAFERRAARGEFTPASDEMAANHYEIAQELCEAAGLPTYEISNHARAGARSRHNLIYWRYQDYVGVGPGAHGRVTLEGAKHATVTHRRPDDYLNAIGASGSGVFESEPLDALAQAREFLTMGLRLAEGVSLKRLENIMPDALDPAPMEALIADEMVEMDDQTLRATFRGRPVLNAVITQLAP